MDRTRRNVEYLKLWTKLYCSLSYPMILHQSFGCVPFSFSKNGIEKSILRYLATETQNLIFLAFFLWTWYQSHLEGMDEDLKLHASFNMLVLLFVIITSWIEPAVTIEKWAIFFKQLVIIDIDLKKHNIEIQDARGLKKSFIVLAGQMVLPLFLCILLERNVDYVETIIVYVVPHCVTSITGYIYCEMVILIREKLSILNDILRNLTHSNFNQISAINDNREENAFNVLCGVCTWHHDLVKLIRLFNEIFGFRMVAYFNYAFLLFATHSFLICRLLNREFNFVHLSEYITVILCVGYTVYRICKLCEYCIQEAKKPSSLIHQIETSNQDIIDEIQMFSIQMLNEDIEFTAAGFFPINYSLLFSMIGGVTTYTIILIQLQDSTIPSKITAEDITSTNRSTLSY